MADPIRASLDAASARLRTNMESDESVCPGGSVI